MKLNASIIYDEMSQELDIDRYGEWEDNLNLVRAEFYPGGDQEFESSHVYIALFDRLPLDPVFSSGVVVICVGGNPPAVYYGGQCVCLIIKDSTDVFTISNMLQKIFNKYDDWAERLQNILSTTASVKDLIENSFVIFNNPILVINSTFHFLAYSQIVDDQENLSIYRPDENGNMKLEALSESVSYNDTYLLNKKPILIKARDIQHISINLFKTNMYAGNLTIAFILREMRDSDIVLAQYLSNIIEKSFEHYSSVFFDHINILRGSIQDLLNGFPLDSTRKGYLEKNNANCTYVCIKMKLEQSSQIKVPMGYMCNLIESTFNGSIAFEHEASIVAFIDLKKIPYNEETLYIMLSDIMSKIRVKAGISGYFSEVSKTKIFYKQACRAIEIGYAMDQEKNLYKFEDYLLYYMMSHCIGEFPQEMIIPKQLSVLIDHDVNSQVDYVQTLRAYLNNSMSITKTTQELHIHRSTFLERLKRIKSILEIELDDPDLRLKLQIGLKILELSQSIENVHS